MHKKRELLAEGSCQNKKGTFFIDSGSVVSLVSPNFLSRIQKLGSVQHCNVVLSSFTQNKVPVQGKIVLEVRLADGTFSHEFIVTGLLDTDFLIGLDFLLDHGLNIDFKTCTMTSSRGTSSEPRPKPADIHHIKRIKCKSTVSLAQNSATIISGKAPRLERNYQGITDPCHRTMTASGAIIGPSLVLTEKSWVPVQCVNITDKPIVLYRGTTLGFLKPATAYESPRGVKLISEDNGTTTVHATNPTDGSRWTRDTLFAALKLDGIQIPMSGEETARLNEVLWKYRSCFAVDKDDFGCCNMFKAHIQLKQDHVPSWTPERKASFHLEHHMEKHLSNMLDTGVIEHIKTESRWNSPLFLVPKSSPDFYHFVSDLRGVNQQCIPDKYDFPNLNYLLDRIGGDSIFSTFDMAAGFHQVPYDEDSKPITAFTYKGNKNSVLGSR